MKKLIICVLLISCVLCGCGNTSTIPDNIDRLVKTCIKDDLVQLNNKLDDVEYEYDGLTKYYKSYKDLIESEDVLIDLYNVLGYFRNKGISNISTSTYFSAFPYNKLEKDYYKLDIIGLKSGQRALQANMKLRLVLNEAGKISECVLEYQSSELLN